MKISLKNVKTFKGHDGIGLSCDLYVNDKKVAAVFDSAHGGENEYTAYGPDYKANYKILQDVEDYAKTLPEKQYPASLGGGSYKQDLGSLINDALAEIEKEKFNKKMEKRFQTHIVVGVPNGESYRELSFGKPAWLLSKVPIKLLQDSIDKKKAELKDGEQILNTNLEALGIKI